ncbi:putative peptidylprolyl isomerase [Helianthus debilis subsp. tardiflorus]
MVCRHRWGKHLRRNFSRSLRRRSGPGMLMTRSQGGPDATGSQFVLCYRKSTDFEGDNTIFGRVIKGMDMVLELEMM